MTTIGAQRIEFSTKKDILGNTIDVWCLSPAWMCWMPWLSDGEEVRPAPKKTIQGNRTSHHDMAGL